VPAFSGTVVGVDAEGEESEADLDIPVGPDNAACHGLLQSV
jgi:hypothetical protein